MSVIIARRGGGSTTAATPGPAVTADPVFANNSWEEIIEACQANLIPKEWTVGDRKSMHINGTDYDVRIIGLNHDVYSDGTGVAPVTFQLVDTHNVGYQMEDTNTNYLGWTGCDMRVSHLYTIISALPDNVKINIRYVNKLTSAGSQNATIETNLDRLFLLSEVEVFGTNSFSFPGEGTQYEFYKNGGSKQKTFNGTQKEWWLRSPYKNGSTFVVVSWDGQAGYAANTVDSLPVSYAFCF